MHASLRDPGPCRDNPPPGMSRAVHHALRAALAEPGGIVLIAGPAGSGRRTTIAAATALRPDAAAAEIADRETADAAVRAALGGSLVVAAIAAPGAVAAITRVRGMKVEPFLFASALRAVIAQRLARRLCPDCREPVQAAAGLAARLGFDPGAIVRESRGCAACGQSGYRGRIGLYEAIAVDTHIRRLVYADGDEAVLASHAFRDRPDLGGAARALVREGEISGEDAIRLGRGGA